MDEIRCILVIFKRWLVETGFPHRLGFKFQDQLGRLMTSQWLTVPRRTPATPNTGGRSPALSSAWPTPVDVNPTGVCCTVDRQYWTHRSYSQFHSNSYSVNSKPITLQFSVFILWLNYIYSNIANGNNGRYICRHQHSLHAPTSDISLLVILFN